MLKAILYARFHPERGPSIIHQYVQDGIDQQTLFNWSEISSYVIPPYDLCNQGLSICNNGHQVIGFPTSIEDTKYERNRFTFNVCFVVSEDQDIRPWTPIVKKTSRFFSTLEEEDGLLAAEEDLDDLKWAGDPEYPVEGVGIVYNMLRDICTSLNLYEETCLRIDAYHVLNLRLDQPRPTPPVVEAWDVPLLIRALPDDTEWSGDLTLEQIRPNLNGINHVQRIAELSDVELHLVKAVVQELVRHDWCVLLDIFHSSAVYAPTTNFTIFVNSPAIQEECQQYITLHSTDTPLSSDTIITLYASLQPGVTIADFLTTHADLTQHIDIHRFITFGVIKTIIRRIHRYPLQMSFSSSTSLTSPRPPTSRIHTSTIAPTRPSTATLAPSQPTSHKSNEEVLRDFDEAWRKAVLSSGWATPPSEPPALLALENGEAKRAADDVRREEQEKLRGCLDGRHCMDQICVEMRMTEVEVLGRLKDWEDVVFLSR